MDIDDEYDFLDLEAKRRLEPLEDDYNRPDLADEPEEDIEYETE